MLSNLLADIRYSLRGFALRPLFAGVVVLTLALGIGMNVAMFSIFEQVLLRPLPVREPDRLVNLSTPSAGSDNATCNPAGDCNAVFSYQMFRDLERLDRPFSGIAAHRSVEANVAYDNQTYAGYAMLVSGSYFPVLGIAPALGRLLGPGDDAVEGEADVVVLSHEYWRNALGGDRAVIGKTLIVNGKPLNIVGIVPEEFKGTTINRRAQVYVPITFRWRDAPGSLPNHDNRIRRWAYLFARLAPGVSLDEAAAAVNPAYRAIINDVEAPLRTGLTEQQLAAFRARTLSLEPGARGQSTIRAYALAPLTVLIVATSLVLLIACVNVANLMLARGSTRVGEIALRASLGAAPERIAGLLIVEALLLASLAAIVSLPLAFAAAHGMGALLPSFAAQTFDFTLNASTLGIALTSALLAAMVFGLAPALKLVRTAPGQVLRTEGTRTTVARGAARFRAALTTTQIGLSTTLLVLAGWFAQSLVNATNVDVGIRADSLVTFGLAPERNGYGPARSSELFKEFERELEALPGVSAVASSVVPLLDGTNWNNNVAIEGVDTGPGVDTNVATNYVSAGFHGALEMPLLAGREFTDGDVENRPKVAVVNERFLEKFGLDRSVVGTHMSFGQGEGAPLDIEIVGVARDAKYSEVKDPTPPQVFVPRSQWFPPSSLNFYVRSTSDSVAIRAGIEQVLARLDPNLPLMDMRTMRDVVRENLFVDRFMSTLALCVALLATLLASIGLYGVLSYNVAQRTREIGLRLALGAAPQHLRSMVLRQVAWMGSVGAVLGIAAALLIGRLAQTLLFGLTPSDPVVPLIATGVLGVVIVAAGYLPARRASNVDPVVALRSE
jgi:putative ABC transport system permease protein